MIRSSSFNAREIAHFSRLATQWWNESGELALLHRMNSLRVQYMLEKIEMTSSSTSIRGLHVLDVGCGGGLLSEHLARLGANTLGIDLSESNIGIAKTHATSDPKLSSYLSYRHASVEDLVNESRRFDIVCSMEVLEHVNNPAQFLENCAELVKHGGHLFLSTIARTPLSYFLTILVAEHSLGLVSKGTHTYSKYVNPSEIVDFFHKDLRWIPSLYNGWPTRLEAEVQGIAYLPWSGRWIRVPSHIPGALLCNYMFWARKPSCS